MSDPITEPATEPTTQPEQEPQEAQEPQEIDYTTLLDASGQFKEDFYSKLPDDVGSHSSIKSIKNVADLAKAFVNTKSLVGKKAEEFWESEDPEIVAKRKEIMGIPKSAEEYELVRPEIDEKIPFDEMSFNAFASKAAELGLTKAQAQALVDWDAERATGVFENVTAMTEEARQNSESALRKAWGTKYDYNLAKAKQAADFLGITDVLEKTGLGNESDVILAIFDKIIPAISEDKLIEAAKQDNLATMEDSLNEVESKLMSFDGDKNSPEYKKLVKDRTELLIRATKK